VRSPAAGIHQPGSDDTVQAYGMLPGYALSDRMARSPRSFREVVKVGYAGKRGGPSLIGCTRIVPQSMQRSSQPSIEVVLEVVAVGSEVAQSRRPRNAKADITARRVNGYGPRAAKPARGSQPARCQGAASFKRR